MVGFRGAPASRLTLSQARELADAATRDLRYQESGKIGPPEVLPMTVG